MIEGQPARVSMRIFLTEIRREIRRARGDGNCGVYSARGAHSLPYETNMSVRRQISEAYNSRALQATDLYRHLEGWTNHTSRRSAAGMCRRRASQVLANKEWLTSADFVAYSWATRQPVLVAQERTVATPAGWEEAPSEGWSRFFTVWYCSPTVGGVVSVTDETAEDTAKEFQGVSRCPSQRSLPLLLRQQRTSPLRLLRSAARARAPGATVGAALGAGAAGGLPSPVGAGGAAHCAIRASEPFRRNSRRSSLRFATRRAVDHLASSVAPASVVL